VSKNERYDVSQHEGHTPGPWEYGNQRERRERALVVMAGNTFVAELSYLFSNMSPHTDEVNPSGLDPDAPDARLIVASPEILDALKEAYVEVDRLHKMWRRNEGIIREAREQLLERAPEMYDVLADEYGCWESRNVSE